MSRRFAQSQEKSRLGTIVIPVTPFAQNCTLLWDRETHEGVAVDPGGEIPKILDAAQSHAITLRAIWLTHGHIDHAAGAPQLAKALGGVPILGPHSADHYWLQGLPQQATYFGFPPTVAFTPDEWLDENQEVMVGAIPFQVLHLPGHTPGHVVFFQPDYRLALVGDVLFAGSIGRTDFPGSDHQALIDGIQKKLFALGDDIVFIPGHGPQSTFGEERAHNPFVRV
ncbi:MBL fold metallo-hydrolase [Hydrogenophilus thiooxidans]|uniref:MBL fold metallo-hydrolase n=1 Tax=Hydrogenophilus thiooxidans TaxID=2820326 RepID=UPI002016D99B|nr:MBL fold metallo-hydrolase [Hydrogenophilus thiooxidans]